MSGRSRFTKSNHPLLGRVKVTRAPKSRSLEPVPKWRLFFVLPAELAFSIADGPYPDVIGVSIFKGTVTITGRKDWVLNQAGAFLMKAARELMPITMVARLTREDDDQAQLIHPPRREEEDAIEIVVASGTPVVVMTGRSMRALVRA